MEIPERASQDFYDRLVREKLTGVAAAAHRAGFLRLSESQGEELLRHQREAMLWALTLERRLLQLSDAFQGASLEFVVLKGSALAHTVYPDPCWRPFGDLDLLVRTSDWRAACSLLSELGFHRKLPEPRPGFGERFANAASHIDGEGCEVDLHRSLVIGPFGLWIDPAELFERKDFFRLGGHLLPRLEDTALLLHACVHAALGYSPPLLLPIRDVAQVAANASIDWARLAAWGRRWKLRAVIQHAFETATDLGLDLPQGVWGLMDVNATRRERRALRSYTTSRRGRGGVALSTLEALPGVRAKLAYISAMLLPSRDFLASRAGSAVSPSVARRWMVPLRWLANILSRR